MRGTRGHGLVALVLSWTVATTGSAAATGSSSGDVVATFSDGGGRTVVLREGTYDGSDGFGWEKIKDKHKITNVEVVEAIVGNPNGGTPHREVDKRTKKLTKDRREYVGYANRARCGINGQCEVVERIPMRVIVEFLHDFAFDGQLGVLTAFCVFGDPAHVECPSWVNKQVNISH